jgi:beta-lactamase regulating signal transducer with metallopeptidase domain
MPSGLSAAIDEVSQPFTAPRASVPITAVRSRPNLLPEVLLAIWALGVMGLAVTWLIRWLRIQAASRSGSPVAMEIPIRTRSSKTSLEPGVFGVFRPVLLLPDGIFERLTPTQIEAVIAHELCHVRNCDNLTAAIHMFVETVFWFHPLVWWMGKRMIAERERACDEEVLNREGSERRAYADAILSVCKLYVESPLACCAGVTGSNLKKRIEAIMINRKGLNMSWSKS